MSFLKSTAVNLAKPTKKINITKRLFVLTIVLGLGTYLMMSEKDKKTFIQFAHQAKEL